VASIAPSMLKDDSIMATTVKDINPAAHQNKKISAPLDSSVNHEILSFGAKRQPNQVES
jgi:hypothetical protein